MHPALPRANNTFPWQTKLLANMTQLQGHKVSVIATTTAVREILKDVVDRNIIFTYLDVRSVFLLSYAQIHQYLFPGQAGVNQREYGGKYFIWVA